MNAIKSDTNLREAVRRREQQLPPLPCDLNERVQKRIAESASAPKSRRLWVYAAVAASIAVLIALTLGIQQRPQEPRVAQQKVKPAVVPSHPVVPQSRPEVVAVGQPEEKPAAAAIGAAPQRSAPASAESVSPLPSAPEGEAPPLWEEAERESEPVFVTSTSPMGVHRMGWRPPRQNAPADSGDDVLKPHAVREQDGTPEGWADMTKWSHRQLSRHKPSKKERQQAAVLGAIARKRWHIDVTSMNTLRYGSRAVTSDFYLELRGDTLRSYLPYLGQVHMPTLSPSIGLNFEEPVLTYKEGKQIDIDVKTLEDSYHYVIDISDDGQAHIRVQPLKRDPISFDGTLDTE